MLFLHLHLTFTPKEKSCFTPFDKMKREKIEDIKKWLFNPFDKISGWTAFFLGIIVVACTVIIGMDIYFPGAIDVPLGSALPKGDAFLFQVAWLLSLVLVFYIVAMLAYEEASFHEVLGAVTLSQYTFLVSLFVSFALPKKFTTALFAYDFYPRVLLDSLKGDVLLIIVVVVLFLLFTAWHLTLLYNAFSHFTGLKKSRLKRGLFTGAILLSFGLSVMMVFYF